MIVPYPHLYLEIETVKSRLELIMKHSGFVLYPRVSPSTNFVQIWNNIHSFNTYPYLKTLLYIKDNSFMVHSRVD